MENRHIRANRLRYDYGFARVEWISDHLKVGTMIHVTNTGYELLGEGPAEIGA